MLPKTETSTEILMPLLQTQYEGLEKRHGTQTNKHKAGL